MISHAGELCFGLPVTAPTYFVRTDTVVKGQIKAVSCKCSQYHKANKCPKKIFLDFDHNFFFFFYSPHEHSVSDNIHCTPRIALDYIMKLKRF